MLLYLIRSSTVYKYNQKCIHSYLVRFSMNNETVYTKTIKYKLKIIFHNNLLKKYTYRIK